MLISTQKQKSASTTWINYTGMMTGLFSVFFIAKTELNYNDQAILILLCTFAPIVLLEIMISKVHCCKETGLDLSQANSLDLTRVVVKLLGFVLTIFVLFLFYSLFDEYDNSFYQPSWNLIKNYAFILSMLVTVYFVWIDQYIVDSYDAYWYLGEFSMGRIHSGCGQIVIEHIRGWMIKGFFLPIMFSSLVLVLQTIQLSIDKIDLSTDLGLFTLAWMLIFLIDLIFVTGGYLLTLRPLNAHIRSTNSSILGWCVTLICYRPLWALVHDKYLNYNIDGLNWSTWLADLPLIHLLWSLSIIGLLMIYVWSTIAFGYRFSNLTNRGIVTNGPYRFSKHPAYIAKNLSWWLVAIPFVSDQGWRVIIMSCSMLLCVNAIYFLRARSEEWHLSMDPEYLTYANWINQNGLFANIRNIGINKTY